MSAPAGPQLVGGAPLGGGFGVQAVVEQVTVFPYTVQASDLGKVKDFTSASAVNVILPVGLPIGFHMGFIQGGAGAVSMVSDGITTVLNRQAFYKTAGQNACGTLITRNTNIFVIAGDLAA